MKTPLLLLLLLTACGPDVSAVVDSYTTEGITIQSELPIAVGAPGNGTKLSTVWIDNDARMVRDAFDEFGILPSADFEKRFGGLSIIVRNVAELDGGRHLEGALRIRGVSRWVDLNRHGNALGHELMHAIGDCGHDARGVWQCPAYVKAQEHFNTYSLRWNF
jgi:hypothetical protein